MLKLPYFTLQIIFLFKEINSSIFNVAQRYTFDIKLYFIHILIQMIEFAIYINSNFHLYYQKSMKQAKAFRSILFTNKSPIERFFIIKKTRFECLYSGFLHSIKSYLSYFYVKNVMVFCSTILSKGYLITAFARSSYDKILHPRGESSLQKRTVFFIAFIFNQNYQN